VLAMAGVRKPRGMDGVDLSPLFRGVQPPERRMAYGGYANWCYARTDRWKLISENRGRARRLYDVRRDPRETRNIAASNRGKVEELWGALVRRAGGEPPVYGSKR
jgi:arylsulfatase A-like enzyme